MLLPFYFFTEAFFNYEMTDEEKSKLSFEHIIKKWVNCIKTEMAYVDEIFYAVLLWTVFFSTRILTRQIIRFFIPLNLGDALMNMKDPMDVPKLKAILEDFISKVVEVEI